MSSTTRLTGLSDDDIVPHSEIMRKYGNSRQERPPWRTRSDLAFFFFLIGVVLPGLRASGYPLLGFRFFDGAMAANLPIMPLVGILAFIPLWFLSKEKQKPLPFDTPIQEGGLDLVRKDIKTKKRLAPSGVVFLGTTEDGQQVWLSRERHAQHFSFFGTTGSGKTSAILGMIANALAQGSGVFVIDGKADSKFYRQIMAMARIFARESDVRYLNFLNVDPAIAESFNTNTMNMFSLAPADDIYNLLVSIKSSMGENNQTFSDRGDTIAMSVVQMLCWMRDYRGMQVSVADFREYISYDNVVRLSLGCLSNSKEVEGGDVFQSNARSLLAYLKSFVPLKDIVSYARYMLNIDVQRLKNIDDEVRKTVPEQVQMDRYGESIKQHGFAIMAFDRPLKTLMDAYGRIFSSRWGDVTIDDVVKNRRIVIAMLPTLAKATPEILSISKVMVSNIRNMASKGLGSRTFGNMKILTDELLVKTNSNFVLTFDEVGQYLQDGMDQLNMQVRSLSISIVIGAQDMVGFKRHSEATAMAMLGSTVYKMFMKIEDPDGTGKYATAMADKADAPMLNSFTTENGVLRAKKSKDGDNISFTTRDRVTFTALQAQETGQGTMVAEGKVVRMRVFYAEPLTNIRPEIMDVFVRRLGAWDPPTVDNILVEKDRETAIAVQSAPKAVLKPPLPVPPPPAPPASAKSALNSLKTRLFQGDPADTSGHAARTGPEFMAPLDLRARMPLPSPPAPPKAGADAYKSFLSEIEAGSTARMRQDHGMKELAREICENRGPVDIYFEFISLIHHGVPIALDERTPIDLGTMFIGLVSLVGVRAHQRRDNRVPPYVPISWMPAHRFDAEDYFDPDDFGESRGGEPVSPMWVEQADAFIGRTAQNNPLSDDIASMFENDQQVDPTNRGLRDMLNNSAPRRDPLQDERSRGFGDDE